LGFRFTCCGVAGRPIDLGVRILLANNHCITDATAGVTQSLRLIVEWLAAAGHTCHVLTTARFESAVTFSIEDHLRALGVDAAQCQLPRRAQRSAAERARRPVVRYAVKDVPVTLLMTRHNDERRPDRREAARAPATEIKNPPRPPWQ